MSERDPFADDVLERLIRSNAQYQQTHGHYIVPLAERLLAARATFRDHREILRAWGLGDADKMSALMLGAFLREFGKAPGLDRETERS